MKNIVLTCIIIFLISAKGNTAEYWKEIPFPVKYENIYQVNGIAVEPSGSIWIGDYKGDIYCYKDGEWIQYLNNTTGLNKNSINGIMVDSKNRKWFTLSRSEANNYTTLLYDGYKWTSFAFPISSDSLGAGYSNRYPIDSVEKCAEDQDGIIWFAGNGGIIQLNPDLSYKIYTTENSALTSNVIKDVAIDGNNTKWFSVNGILVSYNNQEWKTHPIDGNFYIHHLTASKGIGACCGLNYDANGPAIYNGNTWLFLSDITIGNGNIVEGVDTDSNGIYWIISFHYIGHLNYMKGIMKLDGTKTQWFYTGHENTDRFLHFCIGPNDWKYFIGYNVIKIFSEESPISVSEPRAYPFSLDTPHPNPFNPSTSISFTLPVQSNTELSVYSITGQKVRTLLNELMDAGSHSVVWDGRDDSGKSVSSGVFFLHLNAGKNIAVGKMLHVK